MQSCGSRRLAFFAIACLLTGGRVIAERQSTEAYDELYRPQFHFTPAKNWMNDPNGPVYYKGEYHLFYQHNPFANEWGHMSWGHAVSRDLVHWQHLPVAIAEENGIMIFSGSTVVDRDNSTGFCKGNRDDRSCLVAIYTGHTSTLQTQNLAYSNDKGRTWTKFPGNPVIDLHLKDFRDPKVFWHEGSNRWVMVAALPDQHKVRFFASADLKHWSRLSDFGPAGATGGVWECPDLFQLPVEGEPGQTRWVLSVNLNPGGVAGGSGDQYFIGRFDGSGFVNENSSDKTFWADYGKDFYASTSFANIPRADGRRIWLGWLLNWEYGAKTPTDPWRGVQSISRELTLKRFPDGIRLIQQPVRELRMLRRQHTQLEQQSFSEANRGLKSKAAGGETFEIIAEIDPGRAAEVGFKVRQGNNQETVIGVDTRQSKLFVDRARSGNVGFDENFPGRHAAPIRFASGKSVKLHIFVDCSSVETFGNDGEIVISDSIFPQRNSGGIELYSKGGEARIRKLEVWTLRSAWR